jgi:hypothetical protein
MFKKVKCVCPGDIDGRFVDKGSSVLFWTSTIDFSFMSFNRQFIFTDNTIQKGSSHHAMGMYVKCVKNK